ncbi:unnamed protein product [Cylicostephanus goldi]|uniref:Uncharacterized protein n=1 Tax=Cylicostephanus goldi TaxID=71465 RepID=A0A3P6SEF6_CYLGO|nr:unnamed protein product [Cylicostephanus goldi]
MKTAEEAEDEDFDMEGTTGKQRTVGDILGDEEERMIQAPPKDARLADIEQAFISEHQKKLPHVGESKVVEDTLDKGQKATKDSVPNQQASRASSASPQSTPERRAATLEETSEKGEKAKRTVAMQDDSGAAVSSELDSFVERRADTKKSPDTQKAPSMTTVQKANLEKKSKEQLKKAESRLQEKKRTEIDEPLKKGSSKEETESESSKQPKEKKGTKADKPEKRGSKEKQKEKHTNKKTGKS